MDLLGQSALLVGVVSLGLGSSVLTRNIRNKLFLAYAFVCFGVSLWALSFFLERLVGYGFFYRAHLIMNVWLAPLGLSFIRVLSRSQDLFSRRLFDLSLFGAIGLTAAVILDLDSQPWVSNLVIFAPSVIFLQTFQLIWFDQKFKGNLKRIPRLVGLGSGLGRRTLIYFGSWIVLATSVMDHVKFLGTVIPSIGNIALTFYLFFLSQAITQQRFLNFGALLTRFLIVLIMALILTGVYSLLFAYIEGNTPIFFLNSFILSFLLLMMLDPLQAFVRFLASRFVTQENRKLEQTLRDAQRRLIGVVDRDALVKEVFLFLDQVLRPTRTAFFMLESAGTRYQRVRWVESYPESERAAAFDAPRELLRNHPLLAQAEMMRKKGEFPILLEQILENELARSASRTQRERYRGLIEAMHALGCNLLIPLSDDQQVLAFLALEVEAPPEGWGSNWGFLRVIQPYFDSVSETLQNLDVYARQREKERLATLGVMAAGLAHEIRNPLGAIKGAAQFLDPTTERPESRFLRIIIEEVDRLNRVVSEFLDYSKPTSTQMQSVNLGNLLERTLELIRTNTPENISIVFSQSPSPMMVKAAADQLQQVFLNLIQNSLNALKDAPSGRIEVILVELSARKQIRVTVQDNGPGIKRENLDKLFIPFFTTSPSGTGLGLSICQKIVEAHSGRIEVATEEGKFASFQVILPRLENTLEKSAEGRA
jgi:two-component system sensor histidine kinase HydH